MKVLKTDTQGIRQTDVVNWSFHNDVLAVAADDTGTINLFSGNGEDSMIINFMSDECPQEGAILVIANPRYNEFEGSVEMADWTVLRIMRDPAINVE